DPSNHGKVLQVVGARIGVTYIVRRRAIYGPQFNSQANVRKDRIAEDRRDRVGLQKHACVPTSGDHISGPRRSASDEVIRGRSALFPAYAIATVSEHGHAVALRADEIPLNHNAAQVEEANPGEAVARNDVSCGGRHSANEIITATADIDSMPLVGYCCRAGSIGANEIAFDRVAIAA